jgi:hypothetical protein
MVSGRLWAVGAEVWALRHKENAGRFIAKSITMALGQSFEFVMVHALVTPRVLENAGNVH